MGTRRSHQRRYPIRKDGTRRYGKVDVRESNVSGAGCLVWIVATATALIAAGCSLA